MCGGEALTPEQAERGQFDALVHATPLGMFPKVDDCFFRDRIPGEVVMDMVYNPAETVLLRRAAEQGREAIPCSEMFLEQAVAQFELWTGESAPRGLSPFVRKDAPRSTVPELPENTETNDEERD